MKNRKTLAFSKRLFLSMFSMSLILLIFGLLILFGASYKSIANINQENKVSSHKVTANNLSNAISGIDSVIQTAFSQNNALNDLSKDLNHDNRAYSNIRHALSIAKSSDDLISSIGYVDSENCIIKVDVLNNFPYNSYEECIQYYSLQNCSNWNNSKWCFIQGNPRSGKNSSLVNFRSINSISPNQEKEIQLIMFLSEDKLSDRYAYLGNNSYIVNEYGIIVSAIDKTRIGDSAEYFVKEYIDNNKRKSGLISGDDPNDYLISYIPTISSYLVTNIGAEVFDAMRYPVTVASLVILAVGLLLSVLWSREISHRMTKPILKLKRTMEMAADGDLSIRAEIDRNDEIGYLSLSFNDLMDKQENHIEQIRRQQQLTTENELRLLQMQINPHLLYNTLDSALFLVEENHNKEAAGVLGQLSNFFKLSLQSGNKIVTIGKEIEYAESYINIQNSCRMKNFHLYVFGDESVRSEKILHMLIQPVIENAVLHGFEGSYQDGTITINLRRMDHEVIIEITDDGVGMDEEELKQIRLNMYSDEPPQKGFALWNITKRSKLFTGLEHPIEIHSEFGEYTTVVIHIPNNIGDKENV